MYNTVKHKKKYLKVQTNSAGTVIMTQRRKGKYIVTVHRDGEGNVVGVDLEICFLRS